MVEKHARATAETLIIVITDGRSYDDVSQPSNEARLKGIEMFAVGIQDYETRQLRDIASLPTSKHMFTSPDFDTLDMLIEPLARSICSRLT